LSVSKADRTRQFIIERTAPLFNSKGFDGTTLSDLTEATGLSKGAIYGNFNDKEEIASAAFAYSVEKIRSIIHERLSTRKKYAERLFVLFDCYAEYVFSPPIAGGCPLMNAAVQSDDQNPKNRKVVAREINAMIDSIASLIEGGIEAGEFKKGTDSKRLAYIFFCTIEGGIMYARAERSQEPMTIVVNHCKEIIKQISK
jgi:TetR/AcrR family transcriptional regulator, transcriptional repressor for nem operon